jgi:hypothetical protein
MPKQHEALQKSVPCCTICLVAVIVAAHTTVLVGNFKTAGGIEGIGTSTSGWSSIGLNISGSLQAELNVIMKELCYELTQAINKTLANQHILDTILGLAGGIAGGKSTASHAGKALLLLQSHGIMMDQNKSALPDLITKSLDTVLNSLMKEALHMLHLLMKKLKPALLKAGEFIKKFGEKVQNIIEAFSITLDRAQKIFDQVMASSAHKGDDHDLVHNTFTIFDVSNTGAVSAKDLQDTAKLYTIPALQGDKAKHLLNKYDEDSSKDLDKEEFELMVRDPDLPDIMSVVLRSFAKKLSEVAGKVGDSHFRGEIAEDVVDYFTLMAAKNKTKVGWISDALGNGSVPKAFTADVLIQMAIKLDDPNTFKDLHTGSQVVKEMMKLHPDHFSKVMDLISSSQFYVSEGFDPEDHGVVVERVTKWATEAKKKLADESLGFLETGEEESDLLPMDGADFATIDAGGNVYVQRAVLDLMPELARKKAENNTKKHIELRHQEYYSDRDKLFESDTAKYLLLHLTGGEFASDASHHSSSPATRLIKQGVPAHPSTLKFAKWLSYNASQTADMFQKMCFKATKTSSNAIDSFATQIQAMVKKIQGFIKTMLKFCTPDHIKAMEKKFEDFAKHAAKDILKVVEKKVGGLIHTAYPKIKEGLHNAVHQVGNNLGKTIAGALATPLGHALGPAIAGVLRGLIPHGKAPKEIGGEIGKILGNEITSISGDALGSEIGSLLDNLIHSALNAAKGALESMSSGGSSLLQIPTSNIFNHSQVEALHKGPVDAVMLSEIDQKIGTALRHAQVVWQDAVKSTLEDVGAEAVSGRTIGLHQTGENEVALPDAVSGVWQKIVTTLKQITHIMPLATSTLLFARKEVSKLAKNLDSIFTSFDNSGPPVFNQISGLWKMVFTAYFCLMLPFPLCLLFYAFWASGWFGGPGQPREEEDKEPPTYYKKCCNLFNVCCRFCCCGSDDCAAHDTTLCFWAFCIMIQIFVLVLFLISFFFCLFAGIKLFLAAGCAQIYILGDVSVCGHTLSNLRIFLNSFLGSIGDHLLPNVCSERHLLTCEMMAKKMMMSGILTVSGSLIVSVLSFQLLIESAVLHARATDRRALYNDLKAKEEK